MINKGYLEAKSTKESDEVFTPEEAVYPILSFLNLYCKKNNIEKKDITIWCPFDKEESNYVILLKKEKYNVIYSHIENGEDFFSYEPETYDIIISNPPFSKKDLIIKRLYELNKPYAILLPIPSLQGQKRFPYMKDCQALIFNKRINYYKNLETKEIQKGVSFGSFYLCYKFLPKDLIFMEL